MGENYSEIARLAHFCTPQFLVAIGAIVYHYIHYLTCPLMFKILYKKCRHNFFNVKEMCMKDGTKKQDNMKEKL